MCKVGHDHVVVFVRVVIDARRLVLALVEAGEQKAPVDRVAIGDGLAARVPLALVLALGEGRRPQSPA